MLSDISNKSCHFPSTVHVFVPSNLWGFSPCLCFIYIIMWISLGLDIGSFPVKRFVRDMFCTSWFILMAAESHWGSCFGIFCSRPSGLFFKCNLHITKRVSVHFCSWYTSSQLWTLLMFLSVLCCFLNLFYHKGYADHQLLMMLVGSSVLLFKSENHWDGFYCASFR